MQGKDSLAKDETISPPGWASSRPLEDSAGSVPSLCELPRCAETGEESQSIGRNWNQVHQEPT